MVNANFFLPDFLEIQRNGFFYLLEKGIIEEIQKRNPITNVEKQIEIFFYPEYYRFTKPLYSIEQALFFKKSYVAKFYVPVQLTDRKKKQIFLKWVLLAHFPLMTNRGHFVLNGSPRVIIHQLVRSPGIYFRENKHEVFSSKWSEKPITTFRRFYADIICSKGTWLRIETEKDFSMWAKMKKGPKIPLLWFLLGMGLSEKYILNSVSKPTNLFESFQKEIQKLKKSNSNKEPKYPYVSSSKQAWEQIQKLLKLKKTSNKSIVAASFTEKKNSFLQHSSETKNTFASPEGKKVFFDHQKNKEKNFYKKIESFDLGRKWFFNKFMNPQMYALGKQGRLSINKKLGLTISSDQTTLTALDLLLLTDYLMKMQDGFFEVDDIDHLKNKRVRSSGECLQEIFSIGFLRLEKSIRLKLNSSQSIGKFNSSPLNPLKGASGIGSAKPAEAEAKQSSGAPQGFGEGFEGGVFQGEGSQLRTHLLRIRPLTPNGVRGEGAQPAPKEPSQSIRSPFNQNPPFQQGGFNSGTGIEGSPEQTKGRGRRAGPESPAAKTQQHFLGKGEDLVKAQGQSALSQTSKSISQKQNSNFILGFLLNTRPINGAFREFFGTHPLSQFMDQINPLAEITHKRRLTSLGPGGVSRDTATLAIRGIHPSHYGRICPIETPEGKNTGLVNSLTTYAKLSSSGMLKSPFYKIFKGQVQKNLGVFFLDPEQEEHFKIATPDLNFTNLGFLPKNSVPVRTGKRFARMKPNKFALIGVSPLQMISVATSFIPFLEHDDANRALMGSNMQRQAVPLLKPERPFLGTGFEAKVISDSGHAVFAKKSGYVMYSSGSTILLYVF